jgi:hypothetical protein
VLVLDSVALVPVEPGDSPMQLPAETDFGLPEAARPVAPGELELPALPVAPVLVVWPWALPQGNPVENL